MTKDKDFKRIVRARMGRTGERYAQARQQVTEPAGSPPNGRSDFGHAALEKARSLGHHRAGEEHVLLALLESSPESLANQALSGVGITHDAALAALVAHLETLGTPVESRKDGWCTSAPHGTWWWVGPTAWHLASVNQLHGQNTAYSPFCGKWAEPWMR